MSGPRAPFAADDQEETMMRVAKAAVAARLQGRLPRLGKSTRPRALIAAAVVAFSCVPAAAQTVLFVSRNGRDVYGCSVDAPCRTIQRALELVRPGGTISVLDPIQSHRLIIDKPVSIFGPGPEMVFDGLDTGVAVVQVAAPASALVELSGFRVEGPSATSGGIVVDSAREVRLSNCVIRDMSGANAAGLRVRPSVATRVFVSNCAIAQNRNGVIVEPGPEATAAVFLDSVVVDRNGDVGIRAGAGATIRLNDLTITNNGTGLQSVKGGRLISFGNNAVAGNTTDGFPTETIDLR
jgi:hypothetical protein